MVSRQSYRRNEIRRWLIRKVITKYLILCTIITILVSSTITCTAAYFLIEDTKKRLVELENTLKPTPNIELEKTIEDLLGDLK